MIQMYDFFPNFAVFTVLSHLRLLKHAENIHLKSMKSDKNVTGDVLQHSDCLLLARESIISTGPGLTIDLHPSFMIVDS